MIKNYKQYIKESLLDKITGPSIDDMLKHFGNSYDKLINYTIKKDDDQTLLSIYEKLKSENNNNFKDYEHIFYYFLNRSNFYNLTVEIYQRFKNNKELTSVMFNKAIRNYNYELIVDIYKNNKENTDYNEKIVGIFNNIHTNKVFNAYYIGLIDKLIDSGFIIKLNFINEKLINLSNSSSKLIDKILEAYERKKKKFFSSKFNKEELDNLSILLDYKIMNDEVDIIERIFKINDLEKYNHEEGIKIGILRKNINSLKVIFEHDGGIKKSNVDYLDSSLNRVGYVPEIVKLLLEYNCPVSERNVKTAIIYFNPNKKEESLEIIGLLLEKYGEINYNFLREAMYIGKTDIINYLLDNGYDVHYGDDILLTNGCLQGNVKMVIIALEHGADVNARRGDIMFHALSYNRENQTYESIEIIKLLFEYGYKFNIPKYIVSVQNNSQEVLDMIDKYYEEHPFIQNK